MKKRKFSYTAKSVACTGKADGRGWKYSIWPFRTNIPVNPKDEQTDAASFENEILKAGDDDLADYAVTWSDKDRELKHAYCSSKMLLAQAETALKSDKDDFEAAKKEFDEAEDQFEALKQPAMSEKVEWFWISFLAITEFFFNYIIFSIVGAENWETYLIAAGISIALPMSAKYLGFLLKKSMKSDTEKIMIIVMALTPLLVFVCIGILRSALFQSAWADEETQPTIGPWSASLIFMTINLFIFVVGVVISYMAGHDDPENYKTLKVRMERAKARFNKESKDYKESSQTYQKSRILFERAKHKRKEEFDHIVSMAEDIRRIAYHLISIYRDANIGARTSGITPPCFKQPIPQLEIPKQLKPEALDWDCDPDVYNPVFIIHSN